MEKHMSNDLGTDWQIRKAMTAMSVTPALWEPWIKDLNAKDEEITRLRAEVAKRDALMEAGFAEYERRLAKAVEALERSAEGWSNVLYFNIIASQYRTSVGTLRDEARAVLAELKGGKDDE
jgi:hypothetical protein